MHPPIFTAVELAQIEAYKWPIWVAGLAEHFVHLARIAVIFRWVIRPFYAACERVRLPRLRLLDRMWGDAGWASALIFGLGVLAIGWVTDLPDDIYFGYCREKAFGLRTETLSSFLTDIAKGWAIGIVSVAALLLGLFGLARKTKHWWWLLGVPAGVLLVLSTALDPYRARVYYEQKPLPSGELRERITQTLAAAQIDFRDVLVEETLAKEVYLQAYFAGSGPTRTIVLNDSLLKNLTLDETIAAIGHEAGHVDETRWPAQLAAALALLAFLGLIEFVFRLTARRQWWGVTTRADVRCLPLIFAVFGALSLVLGPISSAVSRQRERDADLYGIRLVKQPEAFRSVLVKLARVNKAHPSPPWWVAVQGSHPTIQERIDAIDRGDWELKPR